MKQCVKIKVFTVNYFILHISTYYTIIILLYYYIFIFYFFESFDLLYFERTPPQDTPIWKYVSAVAVRL